MVPSVTLDLYALASGRVIKIEHECPIFNGDQKQVQTNPMLYQGTML